MNMADVIRRMWVVWALSMVAGLALVSCGPEPLDKGEPTQSCAAPEAVCDQAPAAHCDGASVVTYQPDGECDASGECVYQEQSRQACSGDTPLCVDGECVAENQQQDPSGVTYFSDFTEYPSGHDFADFERVLGSNQTMSLQTADGQPAGQLHNPQRETFYFKNVHLPAVGPDEKVQLYATVRFNPGPTTNTPHLALGWAEPASGRQSAELYAHSDSYRYIGWKHGEFFEAEAQAEPLSFTDGDVLHFVHEVDGGVVRQKGWLDADAEPDFVEYADADLGDFVAGVMAFGATAEGEYQILEWGLGVGTDAPRSAAEVPAPEDGPALEVVSEGKTAATVAVTLPMGARWAEYRVRPRGGSFEQWHKRWGADELEMDGLNAQTDYEIEVRPANIAGVGPTAMASFTTSDEDTNNNNNNNTNNNIDIDDPPAPPAPPAAEDSVDGDHQALMDLYDATNGSNWRRNDGWGGPASSMGNWYGVETNASGRVITVKLNGSETKFEDGRVGGNNLQGTLPDSLGNLKKVTYFNVKNNKLTGELPESLGGMESAKYLLLNGRIVDADFESGVGYHHPGKPPGGSWADHRSNNFSGSIPATIGNLDELIWFECTGTGKDGDTGLEGSIPAELGNLAKLEGLFLSYNSLTALPSALGHLTGLLQFDIARPQNDALNGHGLPQWINRWTRLKALHVGKIEWGGDLPDLSGLQNLEVLILTFGGFTGPIPTYMVDGTLPKMNMFSLAWNSFSGELPEFGDMPNLVAFAVTDSDLTGRIPESFWETGRDGIINTNFDRNNLSGPIKADGDLRDLRRIRNLRFADNNLSGQWPDLDWTNQQGRSRHPLRNYARAHFAGNKFVFADMLVVSDQGKTLFEWHREYATSSFSYRPQQRFGSTSNLSGSTIDFSSAVTHSDNRYQWYRNGSAISGETNAIIDASAHGSGTYELRVTNPGVPSLTLKSVEISY